MIKQIQTVDVGNPIITLANETIASGYTYATVKTIQIDYTNTNATLPIKYFKSSVSATVASNTITESCGTGTVPGTCTSSSNTTLTANTWYKTTNDKPSITYKKNGTLYALISDGVNTSETSTYIVTKIDTTKPTISASVDGKNVELQLGDNTGVVGYAVTTTENIPTSWTEITSVTSTTKAYIGTGPGTYYAHVVDVAGNTAKVSFELAQTSFSYAATATTSSYGASRGESCQACQITSVSSYGSCLVNGTSTVSTDSNYHYGTCSNGQSITNSVCGCGVSKGQYKYYDCVASYSCPSGGSLSGTTCTKVTYTCPNGGTLSGTTCVFN